VPDEYLDAVRTWPRAMNTNAWVDSQADADAGNDATRFPLAGASPWAPPEASYESRFVARTGVIEHDLHDALAQADLPADIVAQLEHLFAGRLDAARAAVPGDGFRVIYERADQSDAVTRHPRLTAAEVRFGDRTYTALWFIAPGSTHGEYYAFDGSLLPGEPFAMPVNYDRISSPFGVRMHPVFGEERFHTGVDLTARAGAPVLAAAAGTVATAARRHLGRGDSVHPDERSQHRRGAGTLCIQRLTTSKTQPPSRPSPSSPTLPASHHRPSRLTSETATPPRPGYWPPAASRISGESKSTSSAVRSARLALPPNWC